MSHGKTSLAKGKNEVLCESIRESRSITAAKEGSLATSAGYQGDVNL